MNRVERFFQELVDHTVNTFKNIKMSSSKNGRPTTNIAEQELKTAFHLVDKDQDGQVSVSELQCMLKHLGIHVPDDMIAAVIREASVSGANLLTEHEFLGWISSFLSETPEDVSEDLSAAFRVFDKDQNGYITRDELKEAMEMIGEHVTDEELNDLLGLADTDHDGRIGYEEFAKVLI